MSIFEHIRGLGEQSLPVTYLLYLNYFSHLITQQVINPMFSGDLEWEIPQENLNIEKVIGRGAFSVVSRALAWDIAGKSKWTVVAVKSVQGELFSCTCGIFVCFLFFFE